MDELVKSAGQVVTESGGVAAVLLLGYIPLLWFCKTLINRNEKLVDNYVTLLKDVIISNNKLEGVVNALISKGN